MPFEVVGWLESMGMIRWGYWNVLSFEKSGVHDAGVDAGVGEEIGVGVGVAGEGEAQAGRQPLATN